MLTNNGHIAVTRAEFMQLKREVAELRALISQDSSDKEETLKSLKTRCKDAGITGADRMTREQLKEALGE